MKTRNVYRFHLILEEEAQMLHPEEGWIKQPATERREFRHSGVDLFSQTEAADEKEALMRFDVLKKELRW